MTPDQLACEAYLAAGFLENAPKNAFGEKVITADRALRIQRVLQQIAEQVEQRRTERCASSSNT